MSGSDFMGRPKKDKPNHASGMYEVKITIGHTFDGKPIRKSFYSSVSKSAAKAKAEQFKINQAVSMQTDSPFVSKKECFDTWALKWLETYKLNKVKEHTYLFTYKKNIEKYLIPYFKKAKLAEIKQIDIQNYFNEIKNADNGKPLSLSVLEKHKMILKSIFDTAIDNDLCYKNPVKNINFPRIAPKDEKVFYNAEQAKLFRSYSIANKYYDMVILLDTGIRRSELLGLKWSDIDTDNNILHVQRAVTQTNGKVIIDKPKSETSDRFIPISRDTTSILLKLKTESEYIIAGKTINEPLSPHCYADRFARIMKRISRDTGLPTLTPHELRHTFGTLLRENNVDIYTIQKVMGHSDISVTCSIYVHNDIEVLRKQLKLDEEET